MPIETVSHPLNLAEWNANKEGCAPFYLELMGETSPALDGGFVQLAAETGDGRTTTSQASVYEYWWTIGHEGRPGGASGSRVQKWLGRSSQDWIWDRLEDHAGVVYVFFPTDHGWRVNEVAAAVKYMSPVPHDPTFTERASSAISTAEPLLEDASKLVGLVQPVIGDVASKAAQSLDVLAQMKINQIPQVGGYEWAVAKVTTVSESGGVSYGLMWTLPKLMFEELGGRITGSVAVSFIPVTKQGDEAKTAEPGRVRAQVLSSPTMPTQYGCPASRPSSS
jgi:hypothetical protein